MGRDSISVYRLNYIVSDRAMGLTRAVTPEESLDMGLGLVELLLLFVGEVGEEWVALLSLGQLL